VAQRSAFAAARQHHVMPDNFAVAEHAHGSSARYYWRAFGERAVRQQSAAGGREVLPSCRGRTRARNARGTMVPESKAASSRRTPEHCVLSRALRARRGRCTMSDECVAGTSLEHESRLRITITITNYDYDSRGGMDSSLFTVHRSLPTVHRLLPPVHEAETDLVRVGGVGHVLPDGAVREGARI